MPLIKRYANRKLYDTEKKEYITLASIAEMVRDGKTCQVIEKDTGKDVTSQILAQIIMEQERDAANSLPIPVLEILVQRNKQLIHALRTKFHSPFENLERVINEFNQIIDALVEKGEIAETAGSELVNQFIAYTKQACIPFWINEKTIENKFGELGFPTQREFRLLSQQIDDLNQKIALLNPAKENEQTNEKQIFD